MTDGTQVTKEQTEAFGLGKTLGEMSVSLAHIGRDVTEVKGTTTSMASDMTLVKVALAEHDGRIRKNTDDIEELKAAPKDYATKADHDLLRAEVSSSRLTWPKLLGGAATFIGGAALLLSYANALGAFQR